MSCSLSHTHTHLSVVPVVVETADRETSTMRLSLSLMSFGLSERLMSESTQLGQDQQQCDVTHIQDRYESQTGGCY